MRRTQKASLQRVSQRFQRRLSRAPGRSGWSGGSEQTPRSLCPANECGLVQLPGRLGSEVGRADSGSKCRSEPHKSDRNARKVVLSVLDGLGETIQATPSTKQIHRPIMPDITGANFVVHRRCSLSLLLCLRWRLVSAVRKPCTRTVDSMVAAFTREPEMRRQCSACVSVSIGTPLHPKHSLSLHRYNTHAKTICF
jgi:hypothetical protein